MEALEAVEPDWKYIGYFEFPHFPRVTSERRIVTGIWANFEARSKDAKISVYSVESHGEAAKWLRPDTDQQLADGWQASIFQIGDEGYLSKYKNGDRFYIEFRGGTGVARIEADDLNRVKEFAQTVVEQIRAEQAQPNDCAVSENLKIKKPIPGNMYQNFWNLHANCVSPKNKCKNVSQINDVESCRE